MDNKSRLKLTVVFTLQLSYQLFAYLSRSLPRHRPEGLPPRDMVFAFHSETQESLLDIILEKVEWPLLKALGVAYWVRNAQTLRGIAEKLAKVQFIARRDAHDCALMYLAVGKKAALAGLFRAQKNMKMAEFLGHDFTDERWKSAALKNAYVLLGVQRFELAAAFFLLGGCPEDCLQVLLKNVPDWDLALYVARLWGDRGVVHVVNVLKKQLESMGNSEAVDPWMQSLVHLALHNQEEALTVLLESKKTFGVFDFPALVAFLSSRKHPFDAKSLHLRCAQFYVSLGSPLLALESLILTKHADGDQWKEVAQSCAEQIIRHHCVESERHFEANIDLIREDLSFLEMTFGVNREDVIGRVEAFLSLRKFFFASLVLVVAVKKEDVREGAVSVHLKSICSQVCQETVFARGLPLM